MPSQVFPARRRRRPSVVVGRCRRSCRWPTIALRRPRSWVIGRRGSSVAFGRWSSVVVVCRRPSFVGPPSRVAACRLSSVVNRLSSAVGRPQSSILARRPPPVVLGRPRSPVLNLLSWVVTSSSPVVRRWSSLLIPRSSSVVGRPSPLVGPRSGRSSVVVSQQYSTVNRRRGPGVSSTTQHRRITVLVPNLLLPAAGDGARSVPDAPAHLCNTSSWGLMTRTAVPTSRPALRLPTVVPRRQSFWCSCARALRGPQVRRPTGAGCPLWRRLSATRTPLGRLPGAALAQLEYRLGPNGRHQGSAQAPPGRPGAVLTPGTALVLDCYLYCLGTVPEGTMAGAM